jgi:uncharacterized membrane protein YuzA (DUF378 family)
MTPGDDTRTRRPSRWWASAARSGGDRSQRGQVGPPFWVLAIVSLVIGVVAAIHGDVRYALIGLAGAIGCMLLHFGVNALAREGIRRTSGRKP